MTYPQPSSVAPVLGGQQFFRLKTSLVSPGDIYESQVGALAVALGPDSDLATIALTYVDPNNTLTMVGQATLSPDRSLIGRIDARNDVQYPGLGSRRGRILFSVDDIYDSRWRPEPFPADDRIRFETPVLDVLQYFTLPPSLQPQRSDRVFRYQYFVAPAVGGSSWMVIPAYGRKSGYFTFRNLDGVVTVTARVYGVKLSTSALPGPIGSFQIQLFSNSLLSGASAQYVYKSSTDGIWDLFAIELDDYAGAAMPVTVTLSDDAQ